MKTIILEAGLSEMEYLNLFQKNGISDESLSEIDLEQLQDIMKDCDRLAIRSFYNALSLWKRDNPSETEKQLENLPTGFKKFDKNKDIDIVAILSDDLQGQQAISYYQKLNKLTPVYRTKIIHVVVNFFMRSKIWLKKENFAEITTQILNYFQTGNIDEIVSMNNFGN